MSYPERCGYCGIEYDAGRKHQVLTRRWDEDGLTALAVYVCRACRDHGPPRAPHPLIFPYIANSMRVMDDLHYEFVGLIHATDNMLGRQTYFYEQWDLYLTMLKMKGLPEDAAIRT